MTRRAWIALVVAAVVVAVLLSPLASALPDGLEWAAERLGFSAAEASRSTGPFADYTVPGGLPEPVSTALAGVLGVGLTLALGWGLARLLKGK